ncbi:hypothetical protein [Pedobacter hartonius]|uniref:Dolichyl-phosphate-mannose-protein mannosyltransferase n=1 Tax=Pedobacter hartonius TaxID=425514 RepID=A0A1H4CRB2_9SPHI|nr:hypothetical protein [Pedobacter hartonius]SEA62936.1 hypothetical protein SAMN05443550_104154 [Pedobacter hartonius]
MDTTNKNNEQSKHYFLAGFFLVVTLGFTLLIQSITFFLNGRIGWWQFPLALVLAFSMHVYLLFISPWMATGKLRSQIYSLCLPVVLIVISILVSGHFFDVSDDGQQYHQEAVIQLSQGWNPYHTVLGGSAMDFLKNVTDGWDPYKMGLDYKTIYLIWINHYAKGTEFIQAGIYVMTGHIETGKAVNIILMFAGLLLTLSLLLPKLPPFKAWMTALLLTCNPIAIAQVLTFCVDGVLTSIFLIFIASVILAVKEKHWMHYLLVVLVVILAFGVKFTAVVYIVILMAAAICWLLLNKELKNHKKLIINFAIASILGVLVGFNPYITNTIKEGNPFYPLMGPKKVDILSANIPPTFLERSTAERFFVSLFSHTDNTSVGGVQHDPPVLKVPFTLNKGDIRTFWVDTRVAGFGPWFSGILILSVVLLFILMLKCYRNRRFKDILFIFMALVFTVAIMPESWWARYIPQLWFIPILLLLATELFLPDQYRLLKRAVYITLVVNVGFTFVIIIQNLVITSQITQQLAILKASGRTIIVDFGESPPLRIRLEEQGIPYVEQDLEFMKAIPESFKRSNTQFLPPDHINMDIQPPFIIRFLTKLGIKPNPWGGIGY